MGKFLDGDSRPLALVVDDDPLVRMDIMYMLGELGFEVEVADCVSSALKILDQSAPSVDFLITEIQMPGSRNGVTLANHVSFVWPHIRILVTSGVTIPPTNELPINAQFMVKPVTPSSLNAHIADLANETPVQRTA